jgi:hypothetical protein
MNCTWFTRLTLSGFLALGSVPFALAQKPPLIAGRTVCHVITANGLPGVVIAQTEDAEAAALGAATSMAWELSGESAPVKVVVECAVEPDGRLSDADVQRFYENLLQ